MEQNAPRLRFPGFSGAWEKKTLRNLIRQSGIKNKSQKPLDVYSINNVGGFTPREEQFEEGTLTYADTSMYLIVQPGCFAYNPSRINVGSIGFQNLGKDVQISSLYEIFTVDNNNLTNKFLKEWFKTKSFAKNVRRLSEGGVRSYFFLDKMKQTIINYPSLPEQEKIADFFTALDEKIDLKEKEIEDVKSMKKGFLQKMFPQDGESVPRLRFPGFSGEWERKKLSQYLSVSTERNKDNIYEKKDVYSVSREKGVINQIEYQGRSFAGVSVSNYRVLKTNDIVYTKSPLKANPYGIIETNKNNPGIVSTLYAVYNPLPNVLPVFVQIYFESDFRLNNYLKPLVNIGAKHDMKVKDENALKGIVTFPSLPEQKKIADFFSALDEKIDAMEKQLEDLKEMKKGFLQQMFI